MRRSYSAAGTFSLSLSRLDIEKPPGDIHRWRRTNLVVSFCTKSSKGDVIHYFSWILRKVEPGRKVPGSPGPTVSPASARLPPTGWSTSWTPASSAAPACPADGPSGPGRSSTCQWFRSKSPNMSSSPGLAQCVRNAGCPRWTWAGWRWGNSGWASTCSA